MLLRESGLRQRLEDTDRLVEPSMSVRERGPCRRFEPGLAEILHRLLSELASEGVMRKPLGMLAKAFGQERFDRADEARVKFPAVLLQQPIVRHLLHKRVLEGVLEIG